jgi:hypothetical protein
VGERDKFQIEQVNRLVDDDEVVPHALLLQLVEIHFKNLCPIKPSQPDAQQTHKANERVRGVVVTVVLVGGGGFAAVVGVQMAMMQQAKERARWTASSRTSRNSNYRSAELEINYASHTDEVS